MLHNLLKKFNLSKKFQITKDRDRNKELVLMFPKENGIYILTVDKELERLKGKSDILYIGRSRNLRNRAKFLLKYFLPKDFAGNWGKHTAREAVKKILEETDINLYIQYTTCDNCKDIETLLLQKYCQNHIETPPLNNQRK